MSIETEFHSAVDQSKRLPRRPGNEELLELYALYKQATEGDVSGERPGGFDFKAIAKYDAWFQKKGQTRDKAMQAYISLVAKLEQQSA